MYWTEKCNGRGNFSRGSVLDREMSDDEVYWTEKCLRAKSYDDPIFAICFWLTSKYLLLVCQNQKK